MNQNKWSILIVSVLAIALGLILQSIHMILPWLFGPILASLIVIKLLKKKVIWPVWLGNLGLLILGVQMGSTFTPVVLNDIKQEWLQIVLMSVFILIIALLVSVIFKKIAGVTFETALLSAIPGALSQMVVMAEENKKADLLIVTLTQTSRIMFVVILVPIISAIFSDKSDKAEQITKAPSIFHVLNIQGLLIILIGIIVLFIIFNRLRIPVPQLLAPIFILLTWNLSTGQVFTLNYEFIIFAQILFGIRIGVQIADLINNLNKKTIFAIAFQNISLIVGAFLLVFLFQLFINDNINDLFLSAAPGGMAQIIVVALETGGDVAMISSYHIFRIFFILLIIAPLIKIFLTKRTR
ncbi:AbrB family transcriptional regulator [Mammaliicoccus stepanovicii]|uniref:Ammonia monooxygenase n=1 Tax=Mammaliicoccus stepanovicii TaxID=643214 RepID=A0A239Z3R8_9STAP|nr:AbrB family transcriptional regulator [Mammaliicoccus stepanovicii]PNZ78059.1 aminopeptidase [Mammaliicoccus stepanovicii]GGI40255.1 aminopeptidase [Mammaliicoccus stepanovicii]SNV65174.1 ammonia monooxygenase [Mammaliicoccus stepanovicii]